MMITQFPGTPIFRSVPKYALEDEVFKDAFFQNPFTASWQHNGEARSYLANTQSGDGSYLDPIIFNLTNPDAGSEDTWTFHAVKSGDVDMSFADVASGLDGSEETTTLVINNPTHPCIPSGTTFKAIVSSDQLEDIEGFGLSLEADPQYLDIMGIERKGLQSFSADNASLKDNGSLAIVWVNDQIGQAGTPYSGNVEMFEVQFKTNAQVCNIASRLSADNEELPVQFFFDGDDVPASSISVDVTPTTSTPKLELGDPYPNPFTNQVTIPFTLTESKTIELEVYSSQGFYYNDQATFNAGQHSFVVNSGLSSVPAGTVLYYRLETNEGAALGSIIKQ